MAKSHSRSPVGTSAGSERRLQGGQTGLHKPRRVGRHRSKKGPHVGPRVCLSCDKTFLSEGPWNRICPKCGPRNDQIGGLHGRDRSRAPFRGTGDGPGVHGRYQYGMGDPGNAD